MTEEKNQEKEPKKNAFSNCPHRKECICEVVCDILGKFDSEIFKDVKLPSNEWLAYHRIINYLVHYPDPQPRQVDDLEALTILGLNKDGYSVGDIAFIMMRSKSTIHEVLKSRADALKSFIENLRKEAGVSEAGVVES